MAGLSATNQEVIGVSTPLALRETLAILNDMQRSGVIGQYAICGAVAAFRYIEPAVTQDLDISVSLPRSEGRIVTFEPILTFLKQAGLLAEWRAEGLVMGFWPVQFLMADDPLDREALAEAQTILFDGVSTRVWRVEHLMAKCIQVGRPKDLLRLEQFLDEPFEQAVFCAILARFGLSERWVAYCRRFDRENFCDRNVLDPDA